MQEAEDVAYEEVEEAEVIEESDDESAVDAESVAEVEAEDERDATGGTIPEAELGTETATEAGELDVSGAEEAGSTGDKVIVIEGGEDD